MALMTLGLFVFDNPTLAPQSIDRTTQYTWAQNKPVGEAPTYQFLGRGEDSITLPGVLYPSFTGGKLNLEVIRAMAKSGEAFLLMTGYGEILGNFFIDNVKETQSLFMRDGAPQKIEFTLSLKRYDDEQPELLGDIGKYIPSLIETVVA